MGSVAADGAADVQARIETLLRTGSDLFQLWITERSRALIQICCGAEIWANAVFAVMTARLLPLHLAVEIP
jgi:hypothetical protein